MEVKQYSGYTIEIHDRPDYIINDTEGEPINIAASIVKYYDTVQERIEEAYPSAEIGWRTGQSRVTVWTPTGTDDDEIVTSVNQILIDVYDAGAWYVFDEPDEYITLDIVHPVCYS